MDDEYGSEDDSDSESEPNSEETPWQTVIDLRPMDVSNPRITTTESIADSDCFFFNNALRERLINCAFDEKLARSIFDAISSGKLAMSIPLRKLDIKIENIEDFGLMVCSIELSTVLHHICPELWEITRNIQDDRPGEILAKKTPGPNMLGIPENTKLKKELQEAWDLVWPDRKSDDWRSNWHSFPVAKLPDV